MKERISAVLVALLCTIAVTVGGQERFGSLTGRVADQQSAAVPGVTVTATNIQTGETRSFVTDAA